ncbi:MAG TPA: CDP-diacylglycerol--serine O-phosphatidyltransferase [Candidatus Omnitrophota bacterium]|jgi:CDP-diacylglycerol--serine O-phosphatidyltransferase|nr:MAG: CDP-alcohol phosphatidyltransferase [Candidatus Omnitrophica bacterium ADurb.Bin314]HOE69288.1 CDP-diacylglycerol--serine O-phosphatidyltransferase [Candidatus Omnitrophota bacterium]HPW64790.1 CDP-diacylglycerol--serine O-phosphatidyltransferase [Candidatus Omnitrophota bacterium]HQB94495.1 CDP-diacylglycerol--serine O-phosphatidyltransferase [Candidatus Omnitrophota bacterium]
MKNRFYFSTAAFPNMITMLNLIAGFFSILLATSGKYEFAVWLIFLALILDSLDGHVARIFGNATDFGRELDSLADLVSFVVAPCFLAATVFSPVMSVWMLLVIVCFLSAGAFRLARYNINPTRGGYFEGLPTPAAAMTVSMTILAFHKNAWQSDPSFVISAVFLMTAISFLMVSEIPYPKVSAVKFKVWCPLFFLQLFLAIFFFFFFNAETAISVVFLAFLAIAPFYCTARNGACADVSEAGQDGDLPCS